MIVVLFFGFALFAFPGRFVDEDMLGFLDGLLFVEQHALEKAMGKLRLGTTITENGLRPKTQLTDLQKKDGKIIHLVIFWRSW